MPDPIIRSYERNDLPLAQRLPSLARRFVCLEQAAGISPFDPEALATWVKSQPPSSAGHQTGLLLLNLYGEPTAARFDVLAAAKAWCPEDRQMFINLLRIWQF